MVGDGTLFFAAAFEGLRNRLCTPLQKRLPAI